MELRLVKSIVRSVNKGLEGIYSINMSDVQIIWYSLFLAYAEVDGYKYLYLVTKRGKRVTNLSLIAIGIILISILLFAFSLNADALL